MVRALEPPEVQAARQRLGQLTGRAVETLEDLLGSPAEGVRLGAARDILDRGGVPARVDIDTHIEIGLDEQIEAQLVKLKRAKDKAYEGHHLRKQVQELNEERPLSLLDLLEQGDDDEVAEAELVETPPGPVVRVMDPIWQAEVKAS